MVEDALVDSFRQAGAGVRFDWGATAAATLPGPTCALVVVDVLSFTTAVSVATGRGIAVVPHALGAPGAADLAERLGAALAVPRRERSAAHPWTLSPGALLVAPRTHRLVLPSPNGSAIAAAVAGGRRGDDPNERTDGPAVVAGCVRNVTATVAWLVARGYGTDERPVWLIAAGERWPGGSLRPALEDQLGAGALADALERSGCTLSPEARAAAQTFTGTEDLHAAIARCASGRELSAMGFPEEAEIAAALDTDDHASVMDGEMFVRM
ncbi:MAG: 2-phosphosulfolactate phosphatase [Actinomycetota bacterium]|nr:2-phosphosulfolactate phosphatase [Actinomycetota bacterium]